MLRRGTYHQCNIKIVPGPQRSSSDRAKLEAFSAKIDEFTELPDVIERATLLMGIDATKGNAFSKDTLSIEVSGPDKPQLTIVDLPGLIHSQSSTQSYEDVNVVSDLVRGYMEDPRTVILAVVSASNDYANQIVLRRAQDADPKGERTLGIITKPDALPSGSPTEAAFVGLAANRDINFKLGWHVLCNRNYEKRDVSFETRNKLEKAFFERAPWTAVDTGVELLRSRLSTLLLDHIKKELPRVRREISSGLQSCEKELETLGQRRSTSEEQKRLLYKINEKFFPLCRSAVEGNYENQFFGLSKGPEAEKRRLRAQIQALNSSFAENMRLRGHTKEVVDDDSKELQSETERSETLPPIITRTQGLEWVKPILLGGRGRELPGTYNPLMICELFRDQSQNWEGISHKHVRRVYKRCYRFLEAAFHEIGPSDIIKLLFKHHIRDKMEKRYERAKVELEELLDDQRRHAITYNDHYTETVQKIRDFRNRERIGAIINTAVSQYDPGELSTEMLIQALTTPLSNDKNNYACEEVLDCMLAFYELAYKSFVDNVAIIVVERRLVNNLWDIFSPSSITEMSEDAITKICAETLDDQRKRDQLELKRISLQGGMQVCNMALKGVRGSGQFFFYRVGRCTHANGVVKDPSDSFSIASDSDSDDETVHRTETPRLRPKISRANTSSPAPSSTSARRTGPRKARPSKAKEANPSININAPTSLAPYGSEELVRSFPRQETMHVIRLMCVL